MIGLIDWGNSYLKYILLDNSETSIKESFTSKSNVEQVVSVDNLFKELNAEQLRNIDIIYIASVKSEIENKKLTEILNSHEIGIVFSETKPSFDKIICGYENFESLGVDRWLGIIAGYNSTHTTAIIDIGSAITCDVIDKDGRHLGGQIVAGEKLLLESLKSTGRVRFLKGKVESGEMLLGTSTGHCVKHGVDYMIKGYLSLLIRDLQRVYKIERWLFTGGGASPIRQILLKDSDLINEENSLFDPFLVLKGLLSYAQNLKIEIK
jgi:type III pantothenate kinase